MTYLVKGQALNGTVRWIVNANSVAEAIAIWEEKTYSPKYVEEVREHDSNGKRVY